MCNWGNPFRISMTMSCSQVTLSHFPASWDLVGNREKPRDSVKMIHGSKKRDFVKSFYLAVENFPISTTPDFQAPETGGHLHKMNTFDTGEHSVICCVHTYRSQPDTHVSQPPGTYVRCDSPQKPFISGLATASIPIKPHTRRPAGLVTLLQCSRLYLLALATTASLKLRDFSGAKLFSSHHIL